MNILTFMKFRVMIGWVSTKSNKVRQEAIKNDREYPETAAGRAEDGRQWTETNKPLKKWAREMGKHFTKEQVQMANKHMKKCSSSLAIREIQIKTSMRYHLTPARLAHINKNTNDACWRGCGEKGTLLHCWWSCKLVQPLWKSVWLYTSLQTYIIRCFSCF